MRNHNLRNSKELQKRTVEDPFEISTETYESSRFRCMPAQGSRKSHLTFVMVRDADTGAAGHSVEEAGSARMLLKQNLVFPLQAV
jgi:hypothetical protein